jgi:hypothetical protein
MVSQSDRMDLFPVGGLSQKLMPQSSRGHFEGEMALPRKLVYVTPPHKKRQAPARCRLGDKPFIQVAAPASELMIEMGHGQLPLMPLGQAPQYKKQNHGVQPARDGDEDSLAIGKQPFAYDCPLDPIDEISHV